MQNSVTCAPGPLSCTSLSFAGSWTQYESSWCRQWCSGGAGGGEGRQKLTRYEGVWEWEAVVGSDEN